MDQQEFADVVLDCDILTKKELFDLVKYFNCVLKFPMRFSEAIRPGSLQRIKLNRFWINNEQFILHTYILFYFILFFSFFKLKIQHARG